MLEGLEVVVLDSKEIFNSDNFGRIDSEYYGKNFILQGKKLKAINFKRIGEIANVTDGEHGSPDLDDNSGIIYLSGNNIKENVIDFENVRYCSLKLHQKNLRSALKLNSVLMSIVGTVGKASVVYKSIIANTDRNVATIKDISNVINPYWLSVFLNSRFGTFQTQRYSTGNVQPLLNLLQVRSIVVPIFSLTFQSMIESIVKEVHVLLEQNKFTLNSVETLLLETLGLNNFEHCIESVNLKSFKESFFATGRLDAEYYQKKFDILEKAIRSQKYKTIKEIRTDNYRGMQPIYVENGNLDIINSKHILEDSLDYNGFEKTSSNYWDIQSRARVYKGDILTYTTGANIGRTQVYQSDKKALASNHVNIIRIKEQNPVYIGFVLNSLVGRMQTDKFSAGSAQAELYPKDLDEFLIPIIENTQQEKIAALVEESFRLKKQSEQLLETAKRAVELAIEQDEEAAMRYIEEQSE